MFGAAPAPAGGLGMFGAAPAPAAGAPFGGAPAAWGAPGAVANQFGANTPGAQGAFTMDTKYEDLPQEIRQAMINPLETHIDKLRRLSDKLKLETSNNENDMSNMEKSTQVAS
jgi:hypothetical protein